MGLGKKRQERFKRVSKSRGYTQVNHPHEITSCGRRRAFMQKKKKKNNE